jgi:Uma2 family endonuclease
MATTSQVSLVQYLRSQSKPECELISGELITKPMGTLDHMNMERRLLSLLEIFEPRGIGKVVHELSWRNGDDVDPIRKAA